MRAMVLEKLGPVETNPLKLTEIDKHQIQKPLIKLTDSGNCHENYSET